MTSLLKFFCKKAKIEGSRTLQEVRASEHSGARKLIYADGAVGVRHIDTGETYWIPWCLFQNVQVLMKEPYTPGHYVYDVMAEFHAVDIGWEDDGVEGFLEAMKANLENFDIALAKKAIEGLGRDRPSTTIYVSPSYPDDITARRA
ncbi:hypothetical protein HH212_19145 [Massilia forsythiae]|uniref:Uncharacterized protein n=1 Tax=Massilia forsythiae TaxID=2728020 RepID=A0A7Z2VZA5_9BURK|nr:hypothetical protein [Massilia forsythiae]QJE01874.1 hypothetical protein HH212_19145 [Massilia forsythiae]